MKSTIQSALLPFVLSAAFSGCFLFGSNDPEPLALGDVCQGHSTEFVTQFPNGLGVTSQDCAESENGEWIDGRCYCHGSFE